MELEVQVCVCVCESVSVYFLSEGCDGNSVDERARRERLEGFVVCT